MKEEEKNLKKFIKWEQSKISYSKRKNLFDMVFFDSENQNMVRLKDLTVRDLRRRCSDIAIKKYSNRETPSKVVITSKSNGLSLFLEAEMVLDVIQPGAILVEEQE